MRCLFVLEIKPLMFSSFAKIFSHSVVVFLFLFFMVSFAMQKLLSLIGSHCCFFFLIFIILGGITLIITIISKSDPRSDVPHYMYLEHPFSAIKLDLKPNLKYMPPDLLEEITALTFFRFA